MQISFIRNSLSYWTASDVIQDGNTHLRKLAGCDVNLPLLRCVCMCVCARALTVQQLALQSVTRQWDTHVKDFCGSFARIINTVKFYFGNQNILLWPVHCEFTLMNDKNGNYGWNRLGRHRCAPASPI